MLRAYLENGDSVYMHNYVDRPQKVRVDKQSAKLWSAHPHEHDFTTLKPLHLIPTY